MAKRKGASHVNASSDFAFPPNTDFTIETWVYVEKKNNTKWDTSPDCNVQDESSVIFSIGCQASYTESLILLLFYRCFNGTSERWFELRDKNTPDGTQTQSILISTRATNTIKMPIDERWFHVALVREANSLILFVDGIPTVSGVQNIASKNMGSMNRPLYFGAYDIACERFISFTDPSAVRCEGIGSQYRTLTFLNAVNSTMFQTRVAFGMAI